jgi:hypothetical protein
MAEKPNVIVIFTDDQGSAETKNVISEHPEIVEELQEKITDIVCNG